MKNEREKSASKRLSVLERNKIEIAEGELVRSLDLAARSTVDVY